MYLFNATSHRPSSCHGKNIKAGICAFASLFLLIVASFGDTFVLNNGKTVQGQVEEEREGALIINTGSSVITVSRDMISTVVKSLSLEVLGQQIREALEKGRGMLVQGDREGAKRFYEMEILKLEHTLAAYKDTPQEVWEFRKQLHKARRDTLPPDLESQKVEDLYQKAMDALDRVHYEEAFQILRQAASQDPKRADIQITMGRVASQLGRLDDAIAAYKRVLEINAADHFKDVAPLLPDLLDRRGRELLQEGKPEQALKCYDYYLLMKGDEPGRIVDQDTFLKRRKERAGETEEKKGMRIFDYAEQKDQMDLAKASINRLETLKPEDLKIRQLALETRLLEPYLKTLKEGQFEKAIRLKKDVPETILGSERVVRKIEKAAADLPPESRAQYLFQEASIAFQKGAYIKSQTYSERLIREFSNHPLAKIAGEAQITLRKEIPVEKGLRSVTTLVNQGEIGKAEEAIKTLMQQEGIQTSLQWPQVQKYAKQIVKEKEALALWKDARGKFEKQEYKTGLEQLEKIAAMYPECYKGRMAAEFLKQNRDRIIARIDEASLINKELFVSLEDPLFGTAAPGKQKEAYQSVIRYDGIQSDGERSIWIHVWIPLILGTALLLVYFLRWAPPGRGKYAPPIKVSAWEQKFAKTGNAWAYEEGDCRFCGLSMDKGSRTCPHCGAARKITEVEEMRKRAEEESSLPPPEIREKEYEKLMDCAQEMEEKGLSRDAMKLLQTAHHVCPHRSEAVKFIGELFEKLKQPEKAFLYFHLVSPQDPEKEQYERRIEKIKGSLHRLPIHSYSLIAFLSFAFWWMAFWLAMSLDPWAQAVPFRVGACFVGFLLTTPFWCLEQRRNYKTILEKTQVPVNYCQPLPEERVSFKELHQKANILSSVISNHTCVEVPSPNILRLILSMSLSLMFLLALALMSWYNRAPWSYLSWFAGVILFVYLLEIHPRVVIAHVLLQHFYEETLALWADPEIPFKSGPREEQIRGEFDITSFEDLPVGWACHPRPYQKNLQGYLNGVIQTLNRHARFHGFYKNLWINRDFKMAMPTGFFRLTLLTILVCAAASFMSLFIMVSRTDIQRRYQDSLDRGYQSLLEKKWDAAESYFMNASRINPKGVASSFLMAHLCAARGLFRQAEMNFATAGKRGENIPVVHMHYAWFLQGQGRLKEALLAYKRSLDGDPNNPQLLNNIGAICFKIRDYRNAVSYLERVIKNDPKIGISSITLGLALEELGEHEKAREAFRKAQDAAPGSSQTLIARRHIEKAESLVFALPE